MGRFLLAIVKTVLLVVLAGGAIIASFYFAYLLLLVILLGFVAAVGWYNFNREPSVDWYKYEDS
jgi:hypothetical protein